VSIGNPTDTSTSDALIPIEFMHRTEA